MEDTVLRDWLATAESWRAMPPRGLIGRRGERGTKAWLELQLEEWEATQQGLSL